MKKLIVLSLFLLCGCTQQNTSQDNESRNVKTGLAYHEIQDSNAICVASVYLEDDVILGATIDELTYLSSEEYEHLMTSEQTVTQKHLSSKVENNDAYSQTMKVNGSKQTIKESFDAICEYVKGKSVTDIESMLSQNSDEDVVDAVSGSTLQNTKGYLEAIIEACGNAN